MKNYFTGITNINELKKAYRKLCQLNHPDNGGNAKVMADINDQYTKLFNELKTAHNANCNNSSNETKNDATRPINECPEEFINIIMALVSLKGLNVELCGNWIWISGDTKDHKDALKTIGCRWASKKKCGTGEAKKTPLEVSAQNQWTL